MYIICIIPDCPVTWKFNKVAEWLNYMRVFAIQIQAQSNYPIIDKWSDN